MVGEKKVKKAVKKRFFEVEVPLTSAKVDLYAASIEELNGRVISLDLTRSLRGKNLELKLRVKVENGKLIGEPISAELVKSFIIKMIRKGTDYVEDSFESECKDVKVIVKPFMITRNRVSRAVRKALRELARKTLDSYMRTRDSKEIFSEIMSNKIQKTLSLKLKKIYPLALCEIRIFRVIEKVESVADKSKANVASEAVTAAA
ncbi:hypothetical protein J4408_02555 [Candidatus Pacearchaeota archaeon]|nr:hypothetical protein [Candidatus Pacearchaeota archaeon]